jgi:DNA-binding LacI/PurR family transcriptional regulator
MLLDRPNAWYAVLHAERTRKFGYQFDQEARCYGIGIMTAFTDPGVAPSWARYVGSDGVRRLVRRLGKRYLGCLIPSDRRRIPTVAEWAELLMDYNKPVAWFDQGDDPAEDLPVDPLFIRLRFAETPALELALRYLARRGHRDLLYSWAPTEGNAHRWESFRWRALQKVATDVGLTLRCLHPDEAGSSTPDLLSSQLSRRSPSTALIVPHDHSLPRAMEAVARTRISIPQRLSLISFDNYHVSHGLGVTSVDFGFDYLGYAAFHTLFGAIRARRGFDGSIATRPSVAERGSVGRARKRSGSGGVRK